MATLPRPALLPGPAPGMPAGRALAAMLTGHLLAIALVVALAALALTTNHEAEEARARTAATNAAVALRSSLAAQFDMVDLALRSVAAALQRGGPPTPPAIDGLLSGELAQAPAAQRLAMTDAAGVVRYGAGMAPLMGVDVSDRDYFRRARDDTSGVLVVSEPLLARVSRHWVVVLSRRVSYADGRFGGVVFATLSTDTLHRQLATLDLGRDGAATVRSASQRVIARYTTRPEIGDPVGSTAISPQLADAMRASPGGGSYIAHSALDQVERVAAFSPVPGYPLQVVVGLSTDDYYAAWRRLAAQVATLVAAVVLALGASAWWTARRWRRERSEQAQRLRAGRRAQGLLQAAGDGMVVLDLAGRVVECNAAFDALLGRPHADVVGSRVHDWEARSSAARIDAGLQQAVPGVVRQHETQLRRADGTIVEVEASSVAVDVGDEVLIFASARDIGARKREAAERDAAAQRLRDLYELAPCAYHSLGADGRYVEINATGCDWLGLPREAIVGRLRPTDFFTAEGQAQFAANFERFKQEGRLNRLEFDLIGRHGVKRRVSVLASVVRGADGAYAGSRSVMHDVTDLHLARQQVQQLVREQAAMLDNDLVGIARVRERQVVWANRAMHRLFGHADGTLAGLPTQALFADEAAYRALGEVAYAQLRAGRPWRGQLRMRRRDGGHLWVDLSGREIAPERGESMWAAVDVSALKAQRDEADQGALHDGLTGLANVRLLGDRMQQALAGAARRGQRLAVCVVDLDDFRRLNAREGHDVGDRLLKGLAARLADAVRANDTVARSGGDEFVLLLGALDDPADYAPVVERVVAELRRPFLGDGLQALRLTASVGVALYPDDAGDMGSLLRFADAAVHAAKASGGDRVARFRAGADAA